MENSISVDLKSTNSIDTLQFHWIAEFQDTSYIMQFEDGQEHLFSEVRNRMNELKYFCLYNKDNMVYNRFTVDLEKGQIYYNNGSLISYSDIIEEKKDIRLIFFRRHTVVLGESHNICFFLGLQYNDKSGNNRKIIFQIDKQGNYTVRT